MDVVYPREILWQHLVDLPFFRAMLRAVESCFYRALDFPEPCVDIGAGDGHFASVTFARPLGFGLEVDAALVAEAGRRGAYRYLIRADVGAIPFADGTFASGVSNCVLEHIENIDRALGEIARVLRGGAPFAFTVPGPRFAELLLGSRFARRLGLEGLACRYGRFFNRISRHYHCDGPEVWRERLRVAGFSLEDHFDYFSAGALHTFEVGHALCLPMLLTRKLTGRWVLVRRRFNQLPGYMLARRHFGEPLPMEGAYTFYLARRV